MKRLIPGLLLLVAMTGCTTVTMANGTKVRYIMPQVGVVVRVYNMCAPLVDLETVDGAMVAKGMPYGEGETVPISSAPFSGRYRRLWIVAKAYSENADGTTRLIGVTSQSFSVSTYQGTEYELLILEKTRGDECELRRGR